MTRGHKDRNSDKTRMLDVPTKDEKKLNAFYFDITII